MQDIVDKFDRAKELLEASRNPLLDRDQEEAVAKELLGLGIDALGELIANSRRCAVALETIAENTKPFTGELVTGALAPIELDAERLRPIVESILADNGLRSTHANRLG